MPAASTGPAVKHGRIQQSIVQWCFQEYWNIDQLCGMAKSLGCKSVELCSPDDWPTLKKHGLTLRHRLQRHADAAVCEGV